MQKLIRVLCFSLLVVSGLSAYAATSPLSVSIVPPGQFPSDDFTVAGLRVSALWGSHRNVYGFDFAGLGNVTAQTFTGIGISGLFNITHGTTNAIGLQAAGIVNYNTNKTHVYGMQLAGAMNINEAETSITGLQLALLGNLSDHTNIYGAQIALYNKAQNVYGLQIGLVNVAANLHGLQIGLLNFNASGVFSVSPILNVGF